MLTQPFKTNRTILRMALIIPITALNLMLFSCTARQSSKNEEIQFLDVETKPRFGGGDVNDFSKWIIDRIVYPETAKENGIQGRVFLTFVIDTDGTLTDVAVLRGVDPSLDEEAVRVVSLSPKWTPGKHEGKDVKVRLNFPIIFQLK